MKVLHVNAILDPVAGGGTAERTFQIARFSGRAGVTSAVLTLDLGLDAERIEALTPASLTALHCVLPRFFLFPLPESRIRELVRWADIVHLVGHWTVLNALVSREARKQGKPYVICPAGALPIFGRSPWLKAAYNRLVGRRMVRDASGYVAIAVNEFAHFKNYGIPPERVALIPNGIDPDEFSDSDSDSFRRRFGLPSAPLVLFLGRLAPIKGPDLLLQAFLSIAASHRAVHLVFAGPDGGMLDELRIAASGGPGGERVHFIGPIRGSEKSRAYHSASLLVVPSRQEAMSLVALEAGICGTPVLITDQCGFDEIGAAGGGLVVRASVDALAQGLSTMLASPDELATMGARMRRLTVSRYLWSDIVRKFIEFLSQTTLARSGA